MTATELDGIVWRKSSYSGDNGDCVEVKVEAAGVAVRDSKFSAGPTLAFPVSNWRNFLEGSLR